MRTDRRLLPSLRTETSPMKNRFAVLLTLTAIGALAIAGCGGSDDSSSSDAPTKAEFVAQADEICQGASDSLTEAQSQLGADATDAEAIAFINDTYLPELKDESSQIKALTPPEGDEEAIDSITAALDDGINTIESDPEALLAGATDPLADATAQAKDYGLKVCGQS